MPGFPVFQSVLKLMSIQSTMPTNNLILFCLLLLLLSIFPSIRVFSKDLTLCIGASTLASAIPMNIQGWLPLGWISLQFKGLWKVVSSTTVQKHQILQCFTFFMVQLSYPPIHDYWKNHSFDYTDFCWQVMSLVFNTLSRFVIAFLRRNKHLLIWLQSPSTVI